MQDFGLDCEGGGQPLKGFQQGSDISQLNIFFYFFLLFFLELHLWHMEVPKLGVELELQLLVYGQPQQSGIQATSVTYTTARGNAGSLTHLERPGIEHASSWILAGFLTS